LSLCSLYFSIAAAVGHCCIQALSALNFSVDDQKHVFRILAGLLHLGNMSFDNSNPDAVGVSAASNETVQLCSKLFGVYVIQPKSLHSAMSWFWVGRPIFTCDVVSQPP